MSWTTHPRVMAVRRRSSVINLIVETLAGFSRHQTGRNAAVLTYYGFLTIFPLFLAATTILGFVLDSYPSLQERIVDSAASQIPLIGEDLKKTGAISGSWLALIVGLGIAMWGSMRAFVGVQSAYDDTWDQPLSARANPAVQRGRAMIGIATIAFSQVALFAFATAVDRAPLPGFGRFGILAGSIMINIFVVGMMYRYLTSAPVTWSMAIPGAIVCGVIFTVLQVAGTAIASRALASASAYGNFAAPLAVLSWLSLHFTANLIALEFNAARHRLTERAGGVASRGTVAALKQL